MKRAVQVTETPFQHFSEQVFFCKHGDIVWFETETESLDEFPSEYLFWAAAKLKDSND